MIYTRTCLYQFRCKRTWYKARGCTQCQIIIHISSTEKNLHLIKIFVGRINRKISNLRRTKSSDVKLDAPADNSAYEYRQMLDTVSYLNIIIQYYNQFLLTWIVCVYINDTIPWWRFKTPRVALGCYESNITPYRILVNMTSLKYCLVKLHMLTWWHNLVLSNANFSLANFDSNLKFVNYNCKLPDVDTVAV